jgi:hypothetical protein
MLCRLAFLTLLGAACACDAPPRDKEPVQPAVQGEAAPVSLSKQETDALSERCGKMSLEQFHRARKDGIENTADGKATAEFAHHYNTKLTTCFYLLTVSSSGTLNKMLFDINGGELYGEYLGPAIIESPADARPKTCRIESFYCASGREWDVLVEPYMQE